MFKTLNVGTRHQKAAFSGRRLTYYKEWGPAVANDDAAKLLQNLDGQCNAFAKLFIKSLKAAGHSAQKFESVVRSTLVTEFMFINNWEFIGAGTSNNAIYPYRNTLADPTAAFVDGGVGSFIRKPAGGEWEYYWGATVEVADRVGVPGQNSDNPKASFTDHTIVQIGGKYYDPSYGRDFVSIRAWEEGSVAAFAVQGALTNGSWNLVFRKNPAASAEVYEVESRGPF